MAGDNQNKVIESVTSNPALPLRHELVEVYVDAANASNTVFNFPTNNNLQGKRVLYMDAYCVEVLSTTPTGHAVISVAQLQKTYITLYSIKSTRQNIIKMPGVVLNPYEVPGGTAPNVRTRLLLNNEQTDWNKCEINIPGGVGGGGDVSFLFSVYYIDA